MVNMDQHVANTTTQREISKWIKSGKNVGSNKLHIMCLCVVLCVWPYYLLCNSRTAATYMYIVSANRFWPHVKFKEIKSWIYVWMAIINITTYISLLTAFTLASHLGYCNTTLPIHFDRNKPVEMVASVFSCPLMPDDYVIFRSFVVVCILNTNWHGDVEHFFFFFEFSLNEINCN